jgi:hypothetical protein
MFSQNEVSLPRFDSDPLLYTWTTVLSPEAIKPLQTPDTSGVIQTSLPISIASWVFAPRTLSPFLPAMWLLAIPGGELSRSGLL